MIYADAFILYEYHENVEFWVWWWSGGVLIKVWEVLEVFCGWVFNVSQICRHKYENNGAVDAQAAAIEDEEEPPS